MPSRGSDTPPLGSGLTEQEGDQNMDYMQDVEQARQAVEAAMKELEPLQSNMPDGADKLRVLNATTHLVTASLALNFRKPGVPCRLDFVAATPAAS